MQYEYLTKDGLKKIKDELHDYKFNRRPQASQKVAAAREHGDLKENAEYHAAREELSMVETKIKQLEDRIGRARVINEEDIPDDKIYILFAPEDLQVITGCIETISACKNSIIPIFSESPYCFST